MTLETTHTTTDNRIRKNFSLFPSLKERFTNTTMKKIQNLKKNICI